ncbi:MAG: HAD family phosphatase [Lentisphaeria bacterium]|nr:HAD family phosphatase [Lentisphaeria bacterium]
MTFKAAIFDMDGTLLESMHVWENLAPDFLHRHRISPPADFAIHASVPSIRGAVDYMADFFNMDIDRDAETESIYAALHIFYGSKVTVKPGIIPLLQTITDAGISAGVVTATEPELAELALDFTGLKKFFTGGIFSGAEHNISKKTPVPFQIMSQKLQAQAAETIVFEDACYAAESAAGAGYKVAAVYDASEPEQLRLSEVADWYCTDWREFPLEIFS